MAKVYKDSSGKVVLNSSGQAISTAVHNEWGNTGHVDAEGLAELGWNQNDINYLQSVCWWDEEDDDLWKVTQANKEFGPNGSTPITNAAGVNAHVDDENLIYIPKLSDSSFTYGKYSVALATDGYTIGSTTWYGRLIFYDNVRSIGDLSKLDFSQVSFTNRPNLLGVSENFRGRYHINCRYPVQVVGFKDGQENVILEDISDWDMSLMTTLSSQLLGHNATKIGDISRWDVSNVTIMSSFLNVKKVSSDLNLNTWNTSKVTNMQSCFYGLTFTGKTGGNIIVNNWDTSLVTNMSNMFNGMSNVNTIAIPAIPYGCNTTNMFTSIYAFNGFRNISACGKVSQSISFNYQGLRHLTRESILKVINALDADHPGTLTLHSDVKARLTAEDIAIATNKGWTIA